MNKKLANYLLKLTLAAWGGCVILLLVFGPLNKPANFAPTTPTLDNYSFSVGVWCANQVLNPDSRPTNHQALLHSARQFSQTNV